MFKISDLQNTLHVMQYAYGDFFPLLKTGFERVTCDAF